MFRASLLKCRRVAFAWEGMGRELRSWSPWQSRDCKGLQVGAEESPGEAIHCPRAGLMGHKDALTRQGETCISPVTGASHPNLSAPSLLAKDLVLPTHSSTSPGPAAHPEQSWIEPSSQPLLVSEQAQNPNAEQTLCD